MTAKPSGWDQYPVYPLPGHDWLACCCTRAEDGHCWACGGPKAEHPGRVLHDHVTTYVYPGGESCACGAIRPRVTRCVGAFRKPCLNLTLVILCDWCWGIVESTEPRLRTGVINRHRIPDAPPARSVRLPIRGEVR